MNILDQGRETQLRNLQNKTGQCLEDIRALVSASGLTKHNEILLMLKEKFSLGHGDANALVHYALSSDGQSAAAASGASVADLVNELYSGPRAPLRPIHDRVMEAVEGFGPFEIVPKKGYFSLRRRKQLAMVGPGTRGRLEIGLNMKGLAATSRLIAQPPGGMCQYKVFLASPDEVEDELVSWLRAAYDSAG
jgi:hypothetical protein